VPPSTRSTQVEDLAPGDHEVRRAVEDLLVRVARASGHPAMAEPSMLAWQDGQGFSGLIHRAERVDGYAQIDHRAGTATIEVVTDPDRIEVRRALLATALERLAGSGIREVRTWAYRHRPADDRAPLDLGFAVERDLLQLRAPLPLRVDRPALGAEVQLRSFRPGVDEEAWLEVNNRAFATHPEQGGWDLPTLRRREAAPWFDPEGFILLEVGGRLAGSCWTKVHREARPVLGEIYVISVDPDAQGRGFGRALAIAGMDWLAGRAEVGMLYVDRDNDPALALYRSLGFAVDHLDRCYLWRSGQTPDPGN